MSAQKQKNAEMTQEQASRSLTALIEKLLPVAARKNAAAGPLVSAGASFFYDVERGWETHFLQQDADVRTVRNTVALERSFSEPAVKTIFIPYDASITREVALRVCRRHAQAKTVFYEVNDNE